MTAAAFALVLTAAIVHATWNLLLKRSGGGSAFVWLFASLSSLLYAPLAAVALWHRPAALGWMPLALMAASGVLHTAYYMLLDRGYRSGDLSIVYPIARGTGPLLTLACAVLALHEHPSAVAVAGALMIGAGAVALTGDPRRLQASGRLHAVGFALMTGCTIAAYTIVDKIAVASCHVPPLVQDWSANLGRAVVMTPVALRSPAELRATWRRARREIVGVAILCPLAYILVLTAMVFTPVSYVAPAREISILFGALIGVRLLDEGDALRRTLAAAAMAGGIVCLALG
jgi:drug/metabolite transporter (DMT)-like permease